MTSKIFAKAPQLDGSSNADVDNRLAPLAQSLVGKSR
jgi:hypothetical protein